MCITKEEMSARKNGWWFLIAHKSEQCEGSILRWFSDIERMNKDWSAKYMKKEWLGKNEEEN